MIANPNLGPLVVLLRTLALAGVLIANSHYGAAIRGTVRDVDGNALVGANVVVLPSDEPAGAGLDRSIAPLAEFGQTSADGRFAIENLAGDGPFRVIVAASGRETQSLQAQGDADLELSLAEASSSGAAPDQIVQGRVLDARHQPILALLQPVETEALDRSASQRPWKLLASPRFGAADGRFAIVARAPIASMKVLVRAPGCPPRVVRLRPGMAEDIVVGRGGSVTGRVVAAGAPVADVPISLQAYSYQRGLAEYSRLTAVTNAEGRFTFSRLPTDVEYGLYGAMSELGSRGAAVPARSVYVQQEGEVLDLGDVTQRRSCRISGRIVLSGGEIPAEGLTLTLARETPIDDSISIAIQPDGRFAANGLPPERISLLLGAGSGCEFSSRNRSYAWPHQLIGRVDSDVDGLEILVERSQQKLPIVLAQTQPPPRVGRSLELETLPLAGIERR